MKTLFITLSVFYVFGFAVAIAFGDSVTKNLVKHIHTRATVHQNISKMSNTNTIDYTVAIKTYSI